uniref:Uncharacterized protein n=1 Tax=Oryza rufipogon TaxID=4529 RepID=A0A0E0PRN8_ORYRU
MEAAAVAEMAIVLEDALFCLQCLPLLASDKLTLEHRTSKTRRSRKGFVTGRSGRTNCRYRTREKGPPHPKLPNAITPKHKQSHQPLLSSMYHPRRPAKSPISNQSSIHPCNHPAARAGTHQHHSFAVFNSHKQATEEEVS